MESGALNVIWRTLPIEEFLSLCQTNIYMRDICNRDDTWRFLIKRDFNLEYKEPNPRRKYTQLYDFTIGKDKLEEKYSIYTIRNFSNDFSYITIICRNLDDFLKTVGELYLSKQLDIRLITIINSLIYKEFTTSFMIEKLGIMHDKIKDLRQQEHEKRLGIIIPNAKRSLWSILFYEIQDYNIRIITSFKVKISNSFIS